MTDYRKSYALVHVENAQRMLFGNCLFGDIEAELELALKLLREAEVGARNGALTSAHLEDLANPTRQQAMAASEISEDSQKSFGRPSAPQLDTSRNQAINDPDWSPYAHRGNS